MKTVLLSIFSFFLCNNMFAQSVTLDSISEKYIAIGIINTDSLKKDVLFSKTKEWIALNYNSANDVIQLADKEESKIILKGNFETNLFFKQGFISYTLVFEFKDNRFKYTYTDFSYYSEGSGKINFEEDMAFKKKIINKAEENISVSINNISQYLTSNSNKKTDW